MQKKYGIEDSPDLVFRDLTDWSIVQPNGAPDYRFNDREIIRAFADNCAARSSGCWRTASSSSTTHPIKRGSISAGNSVTRVMHAAAMDWPMVQTGNKSRRKSRATTSSGNGLMRPLEVAAVKAGVDSCSNTG